MQIRHRLIPTALALVAALLLLGCGGSHAAQPTTSSHTAVLRSGPSSCIPASGDGVMGACVPHAFSAEPPSTVTRCVIPDVSEFQGHPDWRAAKAHICGAIARVADMSSGRPDTSFSYNWAQLRKLHIWHAAYAFVRPGDCAGEGRTAYGWVKAQGGLDSGPLIADAEVPLSFTCVTEFTGAVEAASGWHLCVIYTAQGTWPGGTHDGCSLWDAAYGPVPGCVWTCTIVAWQFTDGVFGPFPHSTPGIGSGDISENHGITRIVHRAPCTGKCLRAKRVRELHGHEAKREQLKAQRQHLRHKLRDKGCSSRRHRHERLGVKCSGWFHVGDLVVAHIALEQRYVDRLRGELGL